MISKLNDRLLLIFVVILLSSLNIYTLFKCRTIATRENEYLEAYEQVLRLKGSYETGILAHIISTKGIELRGELLSYKEPKLVLAYNDKACAPCLANELENLKSTYKTDQFKHITILAQVGDKSSLMTLLKAHKIDSIDVIFPDVSELTVPVTNAGGFLVYFFYQPEKPQKCSTTP